MNTLSNQSIPRRVLEVDAVFSATSGLFFLVAAKPLAEFLGASMPVMNILTIIMFGYAALIVFNTSRPAVRRGFLLVTAVSNWAWALASVLLLSLPLFDFSTDAKWAIGVTAAAVDVLGTLQFLQWRKMRG